MPIPADAIEIAYSDEFTASIENRSFVVGDEYEVIYYITGLDESIYYKKCSIKIVENEEETTMETCIDN